MLCIGLSVLWSVGWSVNLCVLLIFWPKCCLICINALVQQVTKFCMITTVCSKINAVAIVITNKFLSIAAECKNSDYCVHSLDSCKEQACSAPTCGKCKPGFTGRKCESKAYCKVSKLVSEKWETRHSCKHVFTKKKVCISCNNYS